MLKFLLEILDVVFLGFAMESLLGDMEVLSAKLE
jgi:hypothetical protein